VIAQMGLEIGGIGGIWRVATLYSVLDMVVGDPVVGSRRMQELDHRSQSEISIENVSTARPYDNEKWEMLRWTGVSLSVCWLFDLGKFYRCQGGC